ncbi:MAG: hypothetical protein ACREDY_15625 [Bradyrhizobium sp.]
MDEFSARRLRAVIPALLEQRKTVLSAGMVFTADLIDLAIMQIRMTLHDISEDELIEFSEALELTLSDSDQVS